MNGPRFSSYTMVLPVYEEEARVAKVIEYYRAFAPLVVIDNFSIDRTAEIARSLGVRVVQHRNAGTCQTSKWFRYATTLFDTEYFALLSCSEFLSPELLARFDEVARERSAGVVTCTRRSYTSGEVIPGLFPDGDVERFFARSELDYDSIVIHGNFAPVRTERRLRLPAEERFLVVHLRDFDAASLMKKVTEYAVVEARDRVRHGSSMGLRWLSSQVLTELSRFLRIPVKRWSRVALREVWARMVMHSVIWWVGWELRRGRTIEDSRARSDVLWRELVSSSMDASSRSELSASVDRRSLSSQRSR